MESNCSVCLIFCMFICCSELCIILMVHLSVSLFLYFLLFFVNTEQLFCKPRCLYVRTLEKVFLFVFEVSHLFFNTEQLFLVATLLVMSISLSFIRKHLKDNSFLKEHKFYRYFIDNIFHGQDIS